MPRTYFEFTAGCLSLNLVDTIANPATDPYELLKNPEDLGRWIVIAFPYIDEAPEVSAPQLDAAKALRAAIFQTASAVVSGNEPSAADIKMINSMAAEPDLRPQWKNGEVSHSARDVVHSALATIAGDAIMVLSNPSAIRVRRCVECQMFFLDNTRAQNRRWCSSSSGCGNRAKVRRHRAAKVREEIHAR